MKAIAKRIGACLLIAALCRGAAAFEKRFIPSVEQRTITEFTSEPEETEIVSTEAARE